MDPSSNKRFQQLVLSAVFTPLLFFTAFAVFAGGYWPIALGIAVLAFGLAMAIPYRPEIDSPIRRTDLIAGKAVDALAIIGGLYCLSELSEAHALWLRLLDGKTLLKAPVLTIGLLWALLKAHRNWQILRHLNDREIENYVHGFEEVRFQGPIHRGRTQAEPRRSRR